MSMIDDAAKSLNVQRECFVAAGVYGSVLMRDWVPLMRQRVALLSRMQALHVMVMTAYEKANMVNPKFKNWRDNVPEEVLHGNE